MVDLYTAAILDSGKPVGKPAAPKRARGKKAAAEPEVPVEPVTPEPEPEVEAKTEAKKGRSEKQIAAAQRMVEARKAKREAAEQERLALEKQAREAEEAAAALAAAKEAKKNEQKEKRRLKREASKPQLAEMSESAPSVSTVTVDEPVAKRVRKSKRESDEAPAWLEKLIAGIKSEESRQSHDKKPMRQIKIEAEEHAQRAWNEPVTRARVQQHQDESLGKMYSMMFSNRNF
jgi:hypothetical protein